MYSHGATQHSVHGKRGFLLNAEEVQFFPRKNRPFQGGLSEAQNGYGLGMIPGHGPHDGQLSSLVFDSSPGCKLSTAPEHENCLSWGPCLVGHGLNPTFRSQVSKADQPQHQIT